MVVVYKRTKRRKKRFIRMKKAPPPLMTPDVEVKGILGSHGNEDDDSLYSPLLSPVLDDSTVSQLCEMGFPVEACRKAVYYTGNTGIDAAMNWIMSHMDDPDFSAPLVLPGSSSGPGTTPTESLSEEHLATIVSMGFSRDQATKALRATNTNCLLSSVTWGRAPCVATMSVTSRRTNNGSSSMIRRSVLQRNLPKTWATCISTVEWPTEAEQRFASGGGEEEDDAIKPQTTASSYQCSGTLHN
ncbi:ubiquitin carboxyl-terminal hydrolase 5-like [Fundulus diaphanus]